MASIQSFVDHENLHSSRKLVPGTRSSHENKLTQSAKAIPRAHRRALGDVGNKTDFIKRVGVTKNGSGLCNSPKPPAINLHKQLHANLDTENERNSDDECPSIDEMPTYDDDLPDDYEDIWPKAERLSLDDLEQLIKWQPCGNSLSEMAFEDEEIREEEEDFPMELFVAVECVPAENDKDTYSFLDDEPLFEFTPLDDDFD